MFSSLSKFSLARSVILKDVPIYVQFYITARCNLTCQQCNIIYANSDVREVTIDEIQRIADNLAELGVAIVLLTGGEPFVRKDLPEIIRAFESRGIHVRMQTNGLASEEKIVAAIEAGGKDISISLDSLRPSVQDHINGEFAKSWHRAINAMALFTKHLPKESSFAALGCVLQRDNLQDVEEVIRFGTAIGWFTSLVPIHVTPFHKPLSFRTFDQSQIFRPDEYTKIDQLIERVREMKKEGFYLYDSDQYLDDIKRFVKGERTTWRSKNKDICDSPNLYFAILPNGDFAPCCDHRISGDRFPTYSSNFVDQFNDRIIHQAAKSITKACEGCMYGSYPEMTIAMRFWAATIDRIKLFLTSPPAKPWPISYEEMLDIAEKIHGKSEEKRTESLNYGQKDLV
jgi:MoaA/NifB/PqqE/SkfB family radical SAM enzyme